MKTLKLFLALILLTFLSTAQAQDVNQTQTFVIDAAQSTMTIEGGSNVRSWDAAVNDIQAVFTADLELLAALNESSMDAISVSEFSVPVKKIESGSNGLNKNIYKYLKEKDYPNITFNLTDTNIKPNPETDGNHFLVEVSGVISAAGVDKEVSFSLNGELLENGTLSLSGTAPLTFSYFDIERPSALLGTVRANEEFDVTFNLILIKK